MTTATLAPSRTSGRLSPAIRRKVPQRAPSIEEPGSVSPETPSPAAGRSAVEFGGVSVVNVGQLERHPHNRRPRPADVVALAQSILENGQLEPCLVRRLPGPGLRAQILSGETRWLAIQELGTGSIEVRVAEVCDDRQALELVALGNSSRRDLDPIQRARLLQQLCLPADQGGSGLTQEQAGRLMSDPESGEPMSRSAVANAIRLLRLPPAIVGMIEDGRLPETYARSVVPIFDSAESSERAVEVLAAAVRKLDCKTRPIRTVPRDDFFWHLKRTLRETTRSIEFFKSPSAWDLDNPVRDHSRALFKPNDEQRKALGIIKVGDEERATNLKLWEQLQRPAAKALLAKQSVGKGKAAAKPGEKKREPTPAEKKAAAKRAAEIYATRIANWVQLWQRWWICVQLSADAENAFRIPATRFVLGCAVTSFSPTHASFTQGLAKAIGKKPNDLSEYGPGDGKRWAALRATMRRDDADGSCRFVSSWATHILGDDRELPASLVRDTAIDMGWTPAQGWGELVVGRRETRQTELLERLLDIHTKDQLIELFGMHRLLAGMKKPQIITQLLGRAELPFPAVLAAPKAGKKPRKGKA